LFIPVKDL